MAKQKAGNTQGVIYSTLRSSILGLNLIPGTVISENDISSRFKVSRTPVREAFIALSNEALLTVMPQKGSMVTRIDIARVEQELFLRENLEPAALRSFIKNHRPSQLAELEKYMELQVEAAGKRKFERFLQYDDLFHRVFFQDQQVAWHALQNMCGHYHRVRLLTIWLQDLVRDIVDEHKRLFQAVKRRNAPRALALLENHLHKLNTEEAMLMRMFPDYFADPNPQEVPLSVDFGGLSIG